MRETTDRIIRASEIGQYAFCSRAWWLGSVQGLSSSNTREMAAGESAHQRHSLRVRATMALTRIAQILLILAALIAAVSLIRACGS